MREKPSFWGFMAVGFIALAGGIVMFVKVVPIGAPEGGVPRDVQMIFTQVYSAQNLIRSERGKYTPALIEIGVDQETCRRYSCLLQLTAEGANYDFRLAKDGQAWFIQAFSPVPIAVEAK